MISCRLFPFPVLIATLLPGLGASSAWAQDAGGVNQFTAAERETLRQAAAAYEQAGRLMEAGQAGEAANEMQQCIESLKEIVGNDSPKLIPHYSDLAHMLESADRYDEAVAPRRRSLELARSVLAEDDSSLLLLRQMLGNCLVNAGRAAEAEPVLLEALRIAQTAYDLNSLEYTVILSNVGYMYRTLHRYAEARPYYEEALAKRRRRSDCPPKLMATALNNLGEALVFLGDYAAARLYLDQALEVLEKHEGVENALGASTLNNIGYLLACEADYEESVAYYSRSLALRKRLFGETHVEVGRSLNNLGAVRLAQGDYRAAIENFTKSLEILLAGRPPSHPDLALIMSQCSECLYRLGDLEAAKQWTSQSLAVTARALGNRNAAMGYSTYDLGVLAMHSGDPVAADRYFRSAIDIISEVLGADAVGLAKLHTGRGVLLASTGQAEDALKCFDASQRILRRHARVVLPGIPAHEQSLHRKMISRRLNSALSFARSSAANAKVQNAAVEWIINNKAVAHEALAKQTQLQFIDAQGDPRTGRLAKIRAELAALAMTEPAAPAEQQARRTRMDELEREEAALARKLAADRPIIGSDRDWFDLASVRELLPKNAVLVEFVRFEPFYFDPVAQDMREEPPRYVAWVVAPEPDAPAQFIDLGPTADIDRLLQDALFKIDSDTLPEGDRQTKGEMEATAAVNDLLGALAERVYAPLAAYVDAADQLVLCPDGNLWVVPWGALPIDSGDQLLIERKIVQLMSTSRDLARQARPSETRSTAAQVFANPDYDLSPALVERAVADLGLMRSGDMPSQIAVDRSFLPVGPLPMTDAEARSIVPHLTKLTGAEPVVFRQGEALEAVAKNCDNPEVLVFGTHAMFLDDDSAQPSPAAESLLGRDLHAPPEAADSPFLRCGLLLAGCNASGRDAFDDGILTGAEVLGIDLRGTRMAVLSACDTGVGQVRDGEGVAGLRQAFQMAGAGAVVASLWAVDDQETAALIADFFENLAAGQTGPAALRSAQLARIRERRTLYGAAHPFYWSAMTYTGN